MIMPRAAPVPGRRTCRARGFTLIELMVVLTIAALLLAIGVPTFRNASLGGRLSAAANNLLASIQLARSEAIKRNLPVTVCASSDGTTCAGGGGWEQGWIVLNEGTDPDTVLQRQQAVPSEFNVTQSGGTAALSFLPTVVGTTTATLTVCRADPVGSEERVLTISGTGSAYVTITTTGTCS